MAFILTDGDPDVVHAQTHGLMSRKNLEFFKDRMARATSHGFVSKYMQRAKDALDAFDFTSIRDRSENVRRRFERAQEDDFIGGIVDLSDFQNAKPRNRAIIMANPRYRRLWYSGMADGFDGLYLDDEHNSVGRDHDLYREIYNGSYVETDDGDGGFVTYLGVVNQYGDAEMSYVDKLESRAIHLTLEEILNRGKQDPGSPTCKTL